MYYGDHMSGWGWFGVSVGMIAFWGLLIAVIVLLVRASGGPGRAASAETRQPEQLLAERFARGEIDESEYRERLAVLHGQLRS